MRVHHVHKSDDYRKAEPPKGMTIEEKTERLRRAIDLERGFIFSRQLLLEECPSHADRVKAREAWNEAVLERQARYDLAEQIRITAMGHHATADLLRERIRVLERCIKELITKAGEAEGEATAKIDEADALYLASGVDTRLTAAEHAWNRATHKTKREIRVSTERLEKLEKRLSRVLAEMGTTSAPSCTAPS